MNKILCLVSLLALIAATLSAKVTEKFTETLPLSATGSLRLENVNGDVDIEAWDKNEVSIEAEKSARHEDYLKQIEIRIDAKPDRIAIETFVPKNVRKWFENAQYSVRYRLRVPAGIRLEKIDVVNSDLNVTGVRGRVNLDTVNGSIDAKGLRADGEFDTVNGGIRASYDSLDGVKKIDLDTVNGSATIFLPANSSGHIVADSVNGSISCDFPIKLEKSSRSYLRGKIGSGEGPSIRLDSVNGGLKIREAKTGN
jgi:DUF4097 and DUF4098 domain-containing protein YvlB